MGESRRETENDETTDETTGSGREHDVPSGDGDEAPQQPDTGADDGDDDQSAASGAEGTLDKVTKRPSDKLGGPSQVRLSLKDHGETVSDGLGGKDTAQFKPAEMAEVVAKGKEGRIFPITLGCDTDGTVKARSLVAKLRPDAEEESVEASRMMESSRRVEVYEEERLRDIHDSSSFNLLASTSLGATLKKVDVFAEQAASFGSRKEARTEKSKRELFVSAVWECRKATIAVPEREIVIAEDAENRIRRVLADNPNLRNIDLLEHDVFLTYGILVPLRYVLGGRYRKKDQVNSSQSLSAARSGFDAGFARHLKVSIPKAGIEAGSRMGAGGGSEQGSHDEIAITWTFGHADTEGGAPAVDGKMADWVESLDDVAALAVIGYEDVRPIWHFFSDDLREAFERRLDMKVLREHYSKLAEDGKRRRIIANALAAVRKVFPGQGTYLPASERTTLGVHPDDMPGVAVLKHDKTHTKRWSSVPFECEDETVTITADRGHVITYVDVAMKHDGGDHYEFTKGGILDERLDMYMVSRKNKGYGWHVKVYQTKREHITEDPRVFFTALLSRALS